MSCISENGAPQLNILLNWLLSNHFSYRRSSQMVICPYSPKKAWMTINVRECVDGLLQTFGMQVNVSFKMPPWFGTLHLILYNINIYCVLFSKLVGVFHSLKCRWNIRHLSESAVDWVLSWIQDVTLFLDTEVYATNSLPVWKIRREKHAWL